LLSIANTFGHYKHKWSYQNYQGRDNSQNITWLNWITLGHGLHNNHHAQPGNYNHAHKKGEFDTAKWFIPLIEKSKTK
jgi:stearoyl-CoA desaturase (delta-9 desaturase)